MQPIAPRAIPELNPRIGGAPGGIRTVGIGGTGDRVSASPFSAPLPAGARDIRSRPLRRP